MINRGALGMVSGMGVVIAALIAGNQAGLRINVTASMPFGLWRVSEPPARLADGMIVVFCMRDSPIAEMALERGYVGSGTCPNGSEPLLKHVAATLNDFVGLTVNGISVNGALQPNTAPLPYDPKGRALAAFPLGEYRVAPDEVWLVSSETPLGFDSRYYGPVRVTDITGIASPLFTW